MSPALEDQVERNKDFEQKVFNDDDSEELQGEGQCLVITGLSVEHQACVENAGTVQGEQADQQQSLIQSDDIVVTVTPTFDGQPLLLPVNTESADDGDRKKYRSHQMISFPQGAWVCGNSVSI